MYHYTDDRVKVHVFICVLAYTLEKVLELQCRELPPVTPAWPLWLKRWYLNEIN